MPRKKCRCTVKKFTSGLKKKKSWAFFGSGRKNRQNRVKCPFTHGKPPGMLRSSLNLNGEMAELVEGAPLLREYGVKNSIEGSNPSLSAIYPRSGEMANHKHENPDVQGRTNAAERRKRESGLSLRHLPA